MWNLRQKLVQFMQGRYGVNDTLNKWLLGTSLALLVLALLFRNGILDILAVLILAYSNYRIFSKNVSRRMTENQKFLALKNRIFSFFRNTFNNLNPKSTYLIYACPKCGQKVRVPKGRGKIAITCPKCHAEFIKRS